MTEFRFPVQNLEILDGKIEDANRRLERNGIEARFAYEIVGGDYRVDEKGEVSIFADVVINHPELEIPGYEFMATVVFEEGGTLLQVAPGKSLTGWGRPDAHRCDHCNVSRPRTRSFIIRNTETGELSQVGTTCLELFMGVHLKGLWALSCFTIEELREMAEEEVTDRFGRTPVSYDVRRMIAVGLAVTDGGKGFVSKSKAQEWDKPSTVGIVLSVINPLPAKKSREFSREMLALADQVDPATIEEILATAETLRDSDYAENAQVVARSSSISHRGLGVLLSLIGVWHRAKEQEAEKKANPVAKGFLADEKVRVRDIAVTVTKVSEFENEWGTKTLIMFRTTEGNVVKWWATGTQDVEPGQEFLLTGTVKAHEVYEGMDQTVVQRCKLTAA